MPKAMRFTGGSFINVDQVRAMNDAERLCVIDHVSVEAIQGVDKLVLYTDKHEDGLPLNTTRIEELTRLHGGDDETDHWRGTRIELFVDESVRYGGRKVGGVAIRKAPDVAAGAVSAAPAKAM